LRFNLYNSCWWGAKAFLALGAGYPIAMPLEVTVRLHEYPAATPQGLVHRLNIEVIESKIARRRGLGADKGQ